MASQIEATVIPSVAGILESAAVARLQPERQAEVTWTEYFIILPHEGPK
jgi:hypothetical protein